MTEFTHAGTVVFEDGQRMNLLLKSHERHWIDDAYRRWRVVDGSLAGNPLGTKPRLLTHSIRARARGVPAQSHMMTHEGRVKGRNYVPGSIRQLRETKLFWIDRDGGRFRKDCGDRTDGYNGERLVLSSVVKYKIVDGLRQPIKRTQGTHEPI